MSTLTVATKRCKTCGIPKPLSLFTRHPKTRDGFQTQCKACRADYIRDRRAADPVLASRNAAQKAAYDVAGRRLREAHRDEFDRYYAEELAMRGLS